jgi:hypothetical protein
MAKGKKKEGLIGGFFHSDDSAEKAEAQQADQSEHGSDGSELASDDAPAVSEVESQPVKSAPNRGLKKFDKFKRGN